MSIPDWIVKLFASIDDMDGEAFVSFLTDEGQFRYGSNPPTIGKEAIREYVTQFFTMFEALRHRLLGVWTHPDAVFVQGEVTYVNQDKSETTLPFVNCFKMRGDRIREYLVYIDPTPLVR